MSSTNQSYFLGRNSEFGVEEDFASLAKCERFSSLLFSMRIKPKNLAKHLAEKSVCRVVRKICSLKPVGNRHSINACANCVCEDSLAMRVLTSGRKNYTIFGILLARMNLGFMKVHISLIVFACTNLDWQLSTHILSSVILEWVRKRSKFVLIFSQKQAPPVK